MKQTTQTTAYKREFSFLDADRKKVNVECEITTRNGYPEFTASGEYNGSLGQCFDSVKPANDSQKEFIKIWNAWHLNGMNAGTALQAEATKDCKNYDESLRRLVTTNKQGQPMNSEQAELMLSIWDELQAAKPPIPTIETMHLNDKERADFFYFNMVARYGGNEFVLLAGDKKESLKDKAEKWFFSKECLLYDIHPVTNELYRYGSEWIRKDLPEDFESDLDSLIDTIEELEEERKGESLADMNDIDLIELIERETSFEGRDAELCAALVKMFDLSQDDLQDVEIDETNVTVQGNEYIAGDDSEMDERLTEEVEQSAWAFTPSFLADYCDLPTEVFEALQGKCEGSNDAILSLIKKSGSIEDFAQDAANADGRGHFLNSYDGGEEEQMINDTVYYAYRSN